MAGTEQAGEAPLLIEKRSKPKQDPIKEGKRRAAWAQAEAEVMAERRRNGLADEATPQAQRLQADTADDPDYVADEDKPVTNIEWATEAEWQEFERRKKEES